MNWQTAYYVKLYRSQSPDWLALSPLTRGLFDELLLLADQAGRIQLGRAGVASVAVPLRGAWAEIEPHVTALLEDGCLRHDSDANTLVIKGFVEAQARAKTPAERKAKSRERARQEGAGEAGTLGHGVSSAPVPDRDVSRPVTPGHVGHAGHDKEQKDQKEKIPPTPRDPSVPAAAAVESARREDSASSELPTAPTETQLVRAYARGVEEGTAGPFGRRLTDEDRGQLAYLWELHARDADEPSAGDFLHRLSDRVSEWVR
jgi:hypothetical protein